jgi:hypothetical protein
MCLFYEKHFYQNFPLRNSDMISPFAFFACPVKCAAYFTGAEPIPLGRLCGEGLVF